MFKKPISDLSFKEKAVANNLVKEFISGSDFIPSKQELAEAIALANSILDDLERASRQADEFLHPKKSK